MAGAASKDCASASRSVLATTSCGGQGTCRVSAGAYSTWGMWRDYRARVFLSLTTAVPRLRTVHALHPEVKEELARAAQADLRRGTWRVEGIRRPAPPTDAS